jgi:hypothetical protein
MFVNTWHHDVWFGDWWSHRWENGDAKVVPIYVDKFRAWRPTQQRPRDGTVVRHKRGGLRKAV